MERMGLCSSLNAGRAGEAKEPSSPHPKETCMVFFLSEGWLEGGGVGFCTRKDPSEFIIFSFWHRVGGGRGIKT